MLQVGHPCFVQLPTESSQRVLHLALVADRVDAQWTLDIEEILSLAPDQEMLVYAEVARKFMKQSIRVCTILATSPRQIVSVQTVGDPIPAESRQSYRVSTAAVELSLTFGKRQGNPLLDISATGFSIKCPDEYKVGALVDAAIQWEQRQYSGPTCVQSVKQLEDGRFRYGLHCVDKRSGSNTLMSGLQKISTDIQRAQLRRMKRA